MHVDRHGPPETNDSRSQKVYKQHEHPGPYHDRDSGHRQALQQFYNHNDKLFLISYTDKGLGSTQLELRTACVENFENLIIHTVRITLLHSACFCKQESPFRSHSQPNSSIMLIRPRVSGATRGNHHLALLWHKMQKSCKTVITPRVRKRGHGGMSKKEIALHRVSDEDARESPLYRLHNLNPPKW